MFWGNKDIDKIMVSKTYLSEKVQSGTGTHSSPKKIYKYMQVICFFVLNNLF